MHASLDLGGGRTARRVDYAPGESPERLLDVLELGPFESVLFVCGGAQGLDRAMAESPALESKLRLLMGRAVVPAAQVARALVCTGGTDSGVMGLVGRAVAAARPGSGESEAWGLPLIGVVPDGVIEAETGPSRTRYEPHHDAFVFTGGESWGAESPALFEVVGAATRRCGRTPRCPRPALTVVVNGGAITRSEVQESLRRGWKIVTVAGSGGYADALAAEAGALEQVTVVDIDDPPETLRRIIGRQLEPDPTELLLVRAWQTFCRYDEAATHMKARWRRLETLISATSVLAVTVALIAQSIMPPEDGPPLTQGLQGLLTFAVVLLPIGLSTMIAARNRFELGLKSVFLRAAAEAVKREIYRFRTGTGIYHRRPRARLAQRLRQINDHAMATVASESWLPADGAVLDMWLDEGDDGFSTLDGDQYIQARLAGQIRYFTSKVQQLESRVRWHQWGIYAVGGLGTLVATDPRLAMWIALTTAVAGVMSANLEREQDTTHLAKYNLTRSSLDNVWNWWHGLSADEQLAHESVERLVSWGETILEQENAEWARSMEQALAGEEEVEAEAEADSSGFGEPSDERS